jgi:methyl-accepting chemotaxis protein
MTTPPATEKKHELPKSSRRHRKGLGIRGKILLFAGVPIIITLLAIIFFAFWTMHEAIVAISKKEIDQAVLNAAKEIERVNQASLAIPQTMALAQSNGMFGDRKASVEYARAVLEANPDLTGAYFGYEPNADTDDVAYLRDKGDTLVAGRPMSDALGPEGASAGRFIPYWFRNREDKAVILLTPLVDMDNSYYYRGNKNRFKGVPEREGIADRFTSMNSRYWTPEKEAALPPGGVMTEPYIYDGKFIVEQTYPIVINGKWVGIAGVDRALRDIQEFVWGLKPFETAEFTVLSRRGRTVVSHHDSKIQYDPTKITDEKLAEMTQQGDRVEDSPEAGYMATIYNSPETFGTARLWTGPDGTSYYIANYRLPSEFGGWTVAMRVKESEILSVFWEALRFNAAIAVLGVGFILVVLMVMARALASRVQLAAIAARRIAEGDLTVKVAADSSDETGQLLDAIGEMVDDLHSLVGQVKRSSVELISTATQINAASKQQEASVNNFGSSANQVTAAVKEISATAQELVRTMDDVTEVAGDTANLADHGRSSLSGMEATMRGLAEASGSISSRLGVISEKSQNIGSVITTITKVADQTNLLSLNAAIEAEKAGEYGLGFAVVAREIRRLADQTAASTLDIEAMVKEMQGSVSSGVMEMDKFTVEVRRAVDEIVRISTQFAKIIEQVQALTPRFETVHEGMQSQSQGAAQISEAMTQLSESARFSANSLREFNQAAEKLAHAVQSLKEEISKFKMK